MRILARKRMKYAENRVFETSQFRIYYVCVKHNKLIRKTNGFLTHTMQGARAIRVAYGLLRFARNDGKGVKTSDGWDKQVPGSLGTYSPRDSR